MLHRKKVIAARANVMNYLGNQSKRRLRTALVERIEKLLTKTLHICRKTFKKFHCPLLEFEFNGVQPMT